MINVYLRGRACIESVRGSLIQGEFLILSVSCSVCFGYEPFLAILVWLAVFLAICWLLQFFLFLMTLLSFSWLLVF
jgi:hypothetical protein